MSKSVKYYTDMRGIHAEGILTENGFTILNTKGRFYCVQFNHDTTDTNFDTVSPMMYVELCRVM